jgi:hypothetical protein
MPSVGFEVLKVVTIKSVVFWVATQYGSERARCFGGTFLLHLQVGE